MLFLKTLIMKLIQGWLIKHALKIAQKQGTKAAVEFMAELAVDTVSKTANTVDNYVLEQLVVTIERKIAERTARHEY